MTRAEKIEEAARALVEVCKGIVVNPVPGSYQHRLNALRAALAAPYMEEGPRLSDLCMVSGEARADAAARRAALALPSVEERPRPPYCLACNDTGKTIDGPFCRACNKRAPPPEAHARCPEPCGPGHREWGSEPCLACNGTGVRMYGGGPCANGCGTKEGGKP